MGFKRYWRKARRAVDRYIAEPFEKFSSNFDTDKLSGADKMEEANDLQRKQYEEQKAAALAQEKEATDAAYLALDRDRRRRALMRGKSSTILTGSLGGTGLTVERKTLLGG